MCVWNQIWEVLRIYGVSEGHKCKAVLDLAEPKSKKDVMMLTRRMAALSRFIAKSGEKSLSFSKCSEGTRTSFGKMSRKKLSRN